MSKGAFELVLCSSRSLCRACRSIPGGVCMINLAPRHVLRPKATEGDRRECGRRVRRSCGSAHSLHMSRNILSPAGPDSLVAISQTDYSHSFYVCSESGNKTSKTLYVAVKYDNKQQAAKYAGRDVDLPTFEQSVHFHFHILDSCSRRGYNVNTLRR